MLRRLLVVGLAWVCFCAPTSARAATVAIFYYPWYSTPTVDGAWKHWDQNDHRPPTDLYSRFYPASGPYSSSDPATVDRQMTEIASVGVDEVIVSWWGRGSLEDRRLPFVLDDARKHHLAVALHIEPYPGRSTATLAQDVEYASFLGIRDLFVYHPRDFAAADWAALHALVPRERIFAGSELVGFAAAGRFDGFYTYDFLTYSGDKFARFCSQAHAMHVLCAPSVGPGYDGHRAGEPPARRDRDNGQTYDTLWNAVLQATPDIVTITSFNEWGEGTQIEPARRRPGYATYDGAWGMWGGTAQFAYLTRTLYWAAKAHAVGARR